MSRHVVTMAGIADLRTEQAEDRGGQVNCCPQETLGNVSGEVTQGLHQVLAFACEEIMPRLRIGERDEIDNLLAALGGRYVPAGPSGAPTRGMAHVLPTGRKPSAAGSPRKVKRPRPCLHV